jgi:hypothetical protein
VAPKFPTLKIIARGGSGIEVRRLPAQDDLE